MRATDETTLISDSGHTCLWLEGEPAAGVVGGMQHGIAEGCLSHEDRAMTRDPVIAWNENAPESWPRAVRRGRPSPPPGEAP